MKISVGEGVEDLDDEGVNNEGVDNSLSPPLSTLKFGLSSVTFNGDMDLELLSIGEKELNLKGGENAALDSFWMLQTGDARLTVAGEERGVLTRVRSKYPRR